ncbi:MAG: PQQ-binding-like beta-propeller repeat protein, partial [Anaerolineales bacterium]
DGAVYFGSDDGFLYALRLRDGRLQWKSRLGSILESKPAAAGDLVVVGSEGGAIFALDRANGQVLWQYQTGGPIPAGPTIADGLMLVGSLDRRVHAFRLEPNDAGEGPP